jgi:hypothetical protein
MLRQQWKQLTDEDLEELERLKRKSRLEGVVWYSKFVLVIIVGIFAADYYTYEQIGFGIFLFVFVVDFIFLESFLWALGIAIFETLLMNEAICLYIDWSDILMK